ncbi:unnamed protein product [Closterium sp. NIES-53]
MFDHTSGAAPAPPATADSATRSQWLTPDAAARLAICNHLPLAECAHFGQHRTAQALYDAVVARYSSPATATLGRLLLPYLFPELSTFATVKDLVSHLRTSDARYRAAAPAEDHFLSLDPTVLTIDLIKQHLLAAETSVVAVGAARGTPRTPFFEGCSPSPLAPSYASAAAIDVPGAEDVGAGFATAKRCSSKGKGGRGSGGGSEGGGGGSSGGGGGSGGGGSGGSGGGSGGFGGGGGGSGGSGGSGSGGSGGSRIGAQRGCSGGGQRQQQQRQSETPSPHAEGDCYLCVPPDPGIEAAALGASEPVLLGTALAEALHTFTLDSGALRCLFRDSTTLTPLSAPVPVRQADPSRGPVLTRSSTMLPCLAVPSGSLSGLLPLVIYELGSSLYTLATEPPQVALSAQVSASGQVAPPCSCRLLPHQTLLWHHRLGHPSLPRLRGMHSRLLVSGLTRSLPPLPPTPALPCLPCVEGRQRAAPHTSSFPPTNAPLQTLHMDVWGPARVRGQGRERNFLLVVDDYTRYTMVFPLRIKGQVVDVLIPWIRAVRLQLRERFRQYLPDLRLHPDRGGEFSSDLLRDFCLMEVARTSLIHAAAPHFPWPFAVGYAACKLNLWPRVSLPETLPTLRWKGKVGDAWVFRFYHPTSRRFFPSQDVTFDEPVPFYRLFPDHSAPPPPPLLFLATRPPLVDPLPPKGPAPSGVSQVDPLPRTMPIEVAVGLGDARGAASGGAASGGAEPGGAESEGAGSGGAEPRGAEPAGAEPAGVEPGGAEPKGVQPGDADSEGAESGGAEPRGTASSGGSADTGVGGAGVTAGAGGTRGAAAASPRGARTRGTGAAGTGGVWEVGAGDPTERGGAGAGGVELLALELEALARCSRRYSQPPYCLLLLLTLSRPAVLQSLVTLHLILPPLFALVVAFLIRVSLLSPEYTLWRFVLPLFHYEFLCCLLLSPLFLPSLTQKSTAASALVAELVDFAAACGLDYAISLVAESKSASPPSVRGECALGTDVLEDRQEEFESLAAAVPRFASMMLAPKGDPDAPDISTPRSYAEAITGFRQRQGVDYFKTFSPTPKITTLWVLLHVAAQRDYELHSLDFITAFLQGCLHEEIWLRRPPGFTGSFPAGTQWSLRRPVYGLRQAPRKWHDTLRTTLAALGFAPSTADPSLTLLTLRSFSALASSSLRHSPLLCLPVTCSHLHLRTSPLLARYVAPGRHRKVHWDAAKRVLRYLCSTSGMGLVLGGRGLVVLTGHTDASWVDDSAMQWSSQGYTFSLGSGSVSWRSTRSSLVLSSSCEAEIHARAMATQELRWLTYLLTDLGEQPRSPPVQYVDNKAMIALCQEHILEHNTKHTALRYFLARELQQRGQLRLAYVATRANTADIFTKALPPGDHQRFSTVLGLVPTLPHLLTT